MKRGHGRPRHPHDATLHHPPLFPPGCAAAPSGRPWAPGRLGSRGTCVAIKVKRAKEEEEEQQPAARDEESPYWNHSMQAKAKANAKAGYAAGQHQQQPPPRPARVWPSTDIDEGLFVADNANKNRWYSRSSSDQGTTTRKTAASAAEGTTTRNPLWC